MHCGTLVLAGLASALAHATPPGERYVSPVQTYFHGEETAGGHFLGVGLAALGAGTGLTFADDGRAFHAAWPVLTIGLVQAIAGVTLLARSEGQITERLARLNTDPEAFLVAERARLEGVHRDVTALIWVEVGLSLVASGLVVAGHVEDLDPMIGVGYGLGAQSLAMLIFDLAVSDRADAYRAALAADPP